MKCYVCQSEISSAIRHFTPPRNRREKDQYRDFCENCYHGQMEKEDYILQGNIWRKGEK